MAALPFTTRSRSTAVPPLARTLLPMRVVDSQSSDILYRFAESLEGGLWVAVCVVR
jgi:hypothetical protein